MGSKALQQCPAPGLGEPCSARTHKLLLDTHAHIEESAHGLTYVAFVLGGVQETMSDKVRAFVDSCDATGISQQDATRAQRPAATAKPSAFKHKRRFHVHAYADSALCLCVQPVQLQAESVTPPHASITSR